MTAARIHIFMDSFGWAVRRDADYNQLETVRNAADLPPLAQDCLITFFNASNPEDLECLLERIQELRSDAKWA